MDLPTSRELELETLLRQRDTQLSELTDEVARLRRYVPPQPGPSTTTSRSLPPAVSAVILSHLSSTERDPTASSSTVVAALTQRTRVLQEENDELYNLLKQSETGKLKEEARALRRLVQRLQNTLQQSHDTIDILSSELQKTRDSFLQTLQPGLDPQMSPQTYPPSPHASYSVPSGGTGSQNSKLPPTGPRKRARLDSNSSSYNQPQSSGKSHSTSNHNHYTHKSTKRGADGHPKRGERDPRGSDSNKGNRSSKMDVDNERLTSSEPTRGRDKMDREYDKGREHNKERPRDRDRDRGPKDIEHNRDSLRNSHNHNGRRNGGAGRGSNRRGDRVAHNNGGGTAPQTSSAAFHGAGNPVSSNGFGVIDRTLAERLGL